MLAPSGKPRWAIIIGAICGAAILLTNYTDDASSGSVIRQEEPWVELVDVPATAVSPTVVHRSCFQRDCATVNGKDLCQTSRAECAPIAEWSHEFAPYFAEETHQVPSTELDFDPFDGAEAKLSKGEKKTLEEFKHKIQKAQKSYAHRVQEAEKATEKEGSPLGGLMKMMRKRHEQQVKIQKEHEEESREDEGEGHGSKAPSSSSECIEQQCVEEQGGRPKCERIATSCGNMMRHMGGGMGGFPFPGAGPVPQAASPDPQGAPAGVVNPFAPPQGGKSSQQMPPGAAAALKGALERALGGQAGQGSGQGGNNGMGGLTKVLKKLFKSGKVHIIRIGAPPAEGGDAGDGAPVVTGPHTAYAKKLWKAEFGGKKNRPKKTSKKAKEAEEGTKGKQGVMPKP